MKKIYLLQVILLISLFSGAQGLSNLFSQQAADLKDMVKQIALWQHYGDWLEKGYQIAKTGLQEISAIKQGEFNLHLVFLTSLTQVNPAIRQSAEFNSLVEYQLGINEILDKVSQFENIHPDEMEFLLSVKENILRDCSRDLDDLINELSDNFFQMGDDDRIRRLREIKRDLESHWKMAKELLGQVRLLAAQRQWEAQDIQTLNNLK